MHKVIIWNDKDSGSVRREISCRAPIRGTRFFDKHVMVVLKREVRLYEVESEPPVLETSFPTVENPHGVCCASASSEEKTGGRMLAFPGRTKGQVCVVSGARFASVTFILAHASALRALEFSRDGALLATASEKGTLVRVWSTATGAKLVELRRGADTATIFSVAFSPSATLLACTSDKGTLHIYDVPYTRPGEATAAPSAASASGGGTAAAGRLGGGPAGVDDDYDDPDMSEFGPESSEADRNSGGWGILGKIPFMPQYFRDAVSFTSADFAVDERTPEDRARVAAEAMIPLGGDPPAPLPKGVIGWLSEDTLVVVGGGVDTRYEKFVIAVGSDGKRFCARSGWMNYMQA